MTSRVLHGCVLLGFAIAIHAHTGLAQDWPQWRGVNRDAKVTGFVAPENWPKELTRKWSVTVGEGVATPALVGDKLHVFSREEGQEVVHAWTPQPEKSAGRTSTPRKVPPARRRRMRDRAARRPWPRARW